MPNHQEPNKPFRPPEPVDFDRAGSLLLAALERRRSRRKAGGSPLVIPAIVIAYRFGIRPHGGRESRRRCVRLLIDDLRSHGHTVLATSGADGGYYLPTDARDLTDYADTRRRGGLAHLTAASDARHSPVLADAHGQLCLY